MFSRFLDWVWLQQFQLASAHTSWRLILWTCHSRCHSITPPYAAWHVCHSGNEQGYLMVVSQSFSGRSKVIWHCSSALQQSHILSLLSHTLHAGTNLPLCFDICHHDEDRLYKVVSPYPTYSWLLYFPNSPWGHHTWLKCLEGLVQGLLLPPFVKHVKTVGTPCLWTFSLSYIIKIFYFPLLDSDTSNKKQSSKRGSKKKKKKDNYNQIKLVLYCKLFNADWCPSGWLIMLGVYTFWAYKKKYTHMQG